MYLYIYLYIYIYIYLILYIYIYIYIYQSSCEVFLGKDVLRKRCSENKPQIYRRTPMSKGDFKITKQLY